MKKKSILISLCILLLLTYQLVAVIKPINVAEGEVEINNTDLMKKEVKNVIEDLKMADEINAVISDKLYLKQQRIDSWSQSEIEYEINLYNDIHRRGTRFRILINENVRPSTRFAYRSRVDVFNYHKITNIFNTDFSVSLSAEQVKEILLILKKYNSY